MIVPRELHRSGLDRANRPANGGEQDFAEAVRDLCYPRLRYPNEYYRASLPSYLRMVSLAYHAGSRRVLELGAGLSTGLWARYADYTGAEVVSVCDDFAAAREYLAETDDRDRVDAHVRCVNACTITAAGLESLYLGEPLADLGGVDASGIRASLDAFVGPWTDANGPRRKSLQNVLRRGEGVAEALFAGGRLCFPRGLLDCYARNMSFDGELMMCRRAEQQGAAGAVDRLADEGSEFDFIFFDSGELSTMVEWLRMKDRVVVGGLVALHDIFFPKSFKSFIICAALKADANWRVVYVDDSTIQGLLVAQRIA